MAFILSDRVKETTSTTGTGTYTLAGASTGFESFASIGDGNKTYYCCTDGTDFEVGVGTYTASGTILARTTILQSSNSDNAVSWTSGTRQIFCTLPAEKSIVKDDDGVISLGGSATTISSTAGNITIDAQGSNTDILLKGTTGGQDKTFLLLDGSSSGFATFSSGLSTFGTLRTTFGNVQVNSDGAKVEFGASKEVDLTHVHNTGLLLTNAGTGTPAIELQFVDSNEAIGSDGTNLLLTSGGNAITVPNSGADTMTLNAATQTLTNKTLTTPTITTPVVNTGLQLKNGATSAGFIEFFEDSDNGTNKVTLIGPASTADVTVTLPDETGKINLSPAKKKHISQMNFLSRNLGSAYHPVAAPAGYYNGQSLWYTNQTFALPWVINGNDDHSTVTIDEVGTRQGFSNAGPSNAFTVLVALFELNEYGAPANKLYETTIDVPANVGVNTFTTKTGLTWSVKPGVYAMICNPSSSHYTMSTYNNASGGSYVKQHFRHTNFNARPGTSLTYDTQTGTGHLYTSTSPKSFNSTLDFTIFNQSFSYAPMMWWRYDTDL